MKRQTVIIRDETTRKIVLGILAAVSLEKPLEVEWQTYRKRRSLNQNSLMWKWINELADRVSDDSGHTSQEIHEYFKAQFLSPRIIEIGGKTIEIRTTTTLNTAEMHDYMERIYQWSATQGYYLPLPEEMGRTR
jgi:hypothetical protein